MTSTVYTFIATRTSYATTIPPVAKDLRDLSRRVRDALLATAYPTRVGELRDFPLPVPVENFLLCDGSEVGQIDFPELYSYLTDTQGAAVDAANFLLPNYLGSKDQSPTAPPQTVDPGSVGIGDPPPETEPDPGEGGGTNGNPPSGGRPRENEREL
ncbi:MAG: phage tail protein [Pseudomonadota bacterium]